MERSIKLTELESRLAELSYPVTREAAATALSDTELRLADGETRLREAVERSGTDRFASADDLASEVRAHLPVEAVGDPHQSDGDA